jgi:serine/threonine-protein kinase RsbW
VLRVNDRARSNKKDSYGEKAAELRRSACKPMSFAGERAVTGTRTEHEAASAPSHAGLDQRVLARRSFPGQPGQIKLARRWIATLIHGFAVADDVILAGSELAANAIVHSDSGLPGGLFIVRLAIEPHLVRIEVLDEGGRWTARNAWIGGSGAHPEDETQCGRGLTIVAAIATSWGISGDQRGRTAWCEIRAH